MQFLVRFINNLYLFLNLTTSIMSRWPQESKGWEEDELVRRTRARLEQGALNLTPSQEATSYQGSMAGTNTQNDDAVSSRVSMYSYRSSDRDNMRLVKEVDGRVSLYIVELFLRLFLIVIHTDHQRPQ